MLYSMTLSFRYCLLLSRMEFSEGEFCAQDYGDIDEAIGDVQSDSYSESLDIMENNEQTGHDNATTFGGSNEEHVEDIEELTDVPTLGMIFNSEQDAYEYYNSYAKTIGFSVRKHRVNRKKNTGVVWKRSYTCSREGFYHKKNTPTKKRDDRRCGCEAQLEIRLQDGKFAVTAFHSEHNHDLVPPSLSHALRSHRNIQSSQGGFMDQMNHAGFKPSQIFR